MRVDIYSDFMLKDILQSYSSIQFSECIRDAGDIQLSFTDGEVYRNISVTEDILVVGNNAYLAENKHKTDSKDLRKYEITGRHITSVLSWRCVKGFEVPVGETYEDACIRLVRENFIFPSDTKRKIDCMAVRKTNLSAKNTVKRIYEANDCLSILKFISKLGGFGFRLEYDIQGKKLVFCCVPVSDRSSTVIFGDKFNNISETDIYEETSDYKNVAYLYTEQTETEEESYAAYGETDAEFVILNSEQYQYNKDYFLGDTVLLTDTDSSLALAKPIEKVTHFYEKTYEMEITYGDAIPTIFTKK